MLEGWVELEMDKEYRGEWIELLLGMGMELEMVVALDWDIEQSAVEMENLL